MSDADEFDYRQALIRSLTPRAPAPKAPAAKVQPLVWWRIKLSAPGVEAVRDISMRTEDARDVADYCRRTYPLAECTFIERRKRAPKGAR